MKLIKNKSFAFAFLLLLLASSASMAQKTQTPPKFVGVRGKEFVLPGGKPIFLKGINLGNWLLPEGYMFDFKKANSAQMIYTVFNQLVGEAEARKFWKQFQDTYITHEDIKFIKKSGFNSVRVPFSYRLFVSENNPQKLEGVGYELLERVVGWCKQEGLYVVLDMHAAPGGQTGDNIDDGAGYPFLFESAEDQDLTIKIWQKLAARYKNESIIIGYDLLNEPIAHYFDKDHFNPKLEPLYKRITAAIRAVDKNHVIFLGGAQWDSNFKVFGAPFDKKLVYTFHKYWTATDQSVIQEYIDFGNKYNVPVWMGESGENTYEWIDAFRKLLEKNQIGWCFWTYKRLNANATIASVKRNKDWDEIVKFAESPRTTFEEIRRERPPKDKIDKALANYLEQIKFANCKINEEYLKALGLK
ncbi:MAG TPA: glycoside hydrolase family 5 protein [Pyrinomonadaceae bacterium]|nr:glycoside hydrolase family 5 protein [Pyrinomonadaceae bacterium]